MIIKIGKSYTSSKKNNIPEKRKIRKIFKRKNKKRTVLNIPREVIKNDKETKTFKYNSTINFTKDIKHLNKCLNHLDKYHKSDEFSVSIDHKKLKEIDNSSILYLTANIDGIISNKKMYKQERLAPKSKIDRRLLKIGYWGALCGNAPFCGEDSDVLRIRFATNFSKVDNNLHTEILNFFSKKHNISDEHRDKLFDAVYEAMANAAEHAFIQNCNIKDKKVWLLGAFNKEKKELEFIFYDIGIGILNSIDENDDYFRNVLKRAKRFFGADKILKILCTTRLTKHKGKKIRGLGMVTFKEFIDKMSEERPANLEVITSNLLYCSKTDKVTQIKGSIKGTLVRWLIGDKI